MIGDAARGLNGTAHARVRAWMRSVTPQASDLGGLPKSAKRLTPIRLMLLAVLDRLPRRVGTSTVPDQEWQAKTLLQRGDELIEDGKRRPGDLHERSLELVRAGWQLRGLGPAERRFRRPLSAQALGEEHACRTNGTSRPS